MTHNTLTAERALLGCLMLDRGLVDEYRDRLQPESLGQAAHARILAHILALHASGVQPDTVTMFERIHGANDANACGGLEYVQALPEQVPSAKGFKGYLRQVEESSTRRRVHTAAVDLQRAASDADSTVSEMLDEAERALSDIVPSNNAAMKDSHDTADAAWLRLEQRMLEHQTGAPSWMPTGIDDLDRLIGTSLRGGKQTVIAARPAMGKAQPLDEPVLTPTGYVPMGSLKVGDYVVGVDGDPRRVQAVHPRGLLPVFKVTMTDGTWTRCCDDHLWETSTRNQRRAKTQPNWSSKSLREIRDTLTRPDGSAPNHAIPVAAPVEFAQRPEWLDIKPYLLGVLLGDGGLSRTTPYVTASEEDIIKKCRTLVPHGCEQRRVDRGFSVVGSPPDPNPLRIALDKYGLRCLSIEKHIPRPYLLAPVADRLHLLQGLNDTDGYVASPSLIEYSTSSERLKDDYIALAQSLGGRCRVIYRERPMFTASDGSKKAGSPNWRIYLSWYASNLCPVSSEKHMAKWRATARRGRLSIRSVEPAGVEECQCITVEGSLYLTRSAIVTHNSALGQQMCMGFARANYGVGFFSLEMCAEDIVHRGWAMTSGVNLDRFNRGNPSRGEQDQIEDAMQEWMGLPLHISDGSGQTLSSIRSQTRRLQMQMARKGTKLGAICVDYLGLMGFENGRKRHEAIGDISRGLKRLARELDIGTIILSQLNRKVEERSNKRPMLSDLRDSGDVEQDADLVLFLYREGYYREDCENPNEAEVICAKQRSGATGTVKLHWQGECTRFLPLDRRYAR